MSKLQPLTISVTICVVETLTYRPHWADPLQAWGDVLMKQGKTREARAKNDKAWRYAPNWKQLKDDRERAI
jgi:hypothetical protein